MNKSDLSLQSTAIKQELSDLFEALRICTVSNPAFLAEHGITEQHFTAIRDAITDLRKAAQGPAGIEV